MSEVSKREVFTQAVLNYKESLGKINRMEELTMSLAAHPDANDVDIAAAALSLIKCKVQARKHRNLLRDLAIKHGTFTQRTWLNNN